MTTIRDVENYLATMARLEQQPPGMSKAPVALPFITISRQAGAGGRSLAKALMQIMATEKDETIFHGWQIMDRQLCEELLGHKGLENSMQSLLSHDYHTQIGEFVLGLFGRQMSQDAAVMQQSKLIRSLASLGKVIIIGRAGSQAAKQLQQGIHVRLVADELIRLQNMLKQSNLGEKDTLRLINEQDQERARLLKDHYQVDIDNPLRYDAVWNTGTISIEAIAVAIVAVIKQRQLAAV